MKGWVSKRTLPAGDAAKGRALAWYLLDDGSMLALVIGWGLRREPSSQALVSSFRDNPDWEEVSFSPTLR